MKYFKLFENFCQDLITESIQDEIKAKKEEFKKLDDELNSLWDIKKELDNKAEPIYNKLLGQGLKQAEIQEHPDYKDLYKEMEENRAARKEVSSKMKPIQSEIEKLQKEEKKKSASGSNSDDLIDDLETNLEIDLEYEFGLVPSAQLSGIAKGDNEVIKKVKQRITELQDAMGKYKGALEDAKLDKDREEMKYQQAKIKSAEAEIVVYDACLKQDKKQLVKGLTALTKIAKVLSSL